MNVEQIAMICHEANKAYCLSNGDNSQVSWHAAPDNIRASAVSGVAHRLANPLATPKGMHEAWKEFKVNDGWVFGHVKNAEAKTHPCLVEYDQLPEFDKMKDVLFSAIVDVFRSQVPSIS